MRISDFMHDIPQPLRFVFYMILVFFVWVLDYITGPDLSFIAFYLIPLALAAWFSDKATSVVVAIACASAYFISDFFTHMPYSHPIVPYWNVAAHSIFFLFVVELISRIKAALVREQQLARKDSLTGAGNRRAFFETAQIEIDRTHRYKRPFTLVYFDIDNFKKLNDTFGHETGDRVLRILVNTVHTNIRSTDIFARIGGDEFVLLLSETGFEQAAPVIDKIEKLIIARLNAARLPVTLSTGAITFLRPPTTVDDLLKKTDTVMYTVKKAGKNRIKHIIWKESAIAH